MTRDPQHTAFDSMHPIVPTIYFVGTIGLLVLTVQPVFVLLGLLGALACSFAYRGVRATLRGLRWQLPMMALVCLANPFFSASGSTVLWRWGGFAVYAESLAYGAIMGCLMVATVLWFECAARVLTQDKMLAVGGRALPTVSLMVSMVAQLMPQLVRRGSAVRETMAACTAASSRRHSNNAQAQSSGMREGVDAMPGTEAPSEEPAGLRVRLGRKLAPHVRLSNVLLGWSLEDSIERADSMRARGWGALDPGQRTSYRTYAYHRCDAVATVGLCLLLALDAFLCAVASSQWHFYPTMPRLVAWWGYLPHVVLLALPTVLQVAEDLRWR